METWVGGERWAERGAEQAAEILAWGLMETDFSVRWFETNADGTISRTTRLLKIPSTNHDELLSAYRQLTGELPLKRLAEGPLDVDAVDETTSPEAQRMSSGSQQQ